MAMIPLFEIRKRRRLKLSKERLDKLARDGRIKGAKLQPLGGFGRNVWHAPENAEIIRFAPGRPKKTGAKPRARA
jgi:hypothetical protein